MRRGKKEKRKGKKGSLAEAVGDRTRRFFQRRGHPGRCGAQLPPSGSPYLYTVFFGARRVQLQKKQHEPAPLHLEAITTAIIQPATSSDQVSFTSLLLPVAKPSVATTFAGHASSSQLWLRLWLRLRLRWRFRLGYWLLSAPRKPPIWKRGGKTRIRGSGAAGQDSKVRVLVAAFLRYEHIDLTIIAAS